MSLTIPRPASSTRRTPKFIAPGTGSFAVYDGTTLVYVANVEFDSQTQFVTVYAAAGPTTVTPGTCTFTSSTSVCALTVTTTVGAHAFDLIAYPGAQTAGTPQTLTGVISSEGEVSVNLSPGTNPGATLTMDGVADQLLFAGLSEAAYNATVTYGYRIEDSTNEQIVQPGTYDNGPVTITATPSGIVTIAPNSFTAPPASLGDQNFDVTCVNPNGGAVTITFNVSTQPDTAYASGLTYSTSNYPGATIASIPFTCDPATGSDSDHRRRGIIIT